MAKTRSEPPIQHGFRQRVVQSVGVGLGMAARQFEPPAGFARQLLKDLDMVLAVAKQTQTPLPITSEAGMLYRLLVARGHGLNDTTAILKLYDKPPF